MTTALTTTTRHGSGISRLDKSHGNSTNSLPTRTNVLCKLTDSLLADWLARWVHKSSACAPRSSLRLESDDDGCGGGVVILLVVVVVLAHLFCFAAGDGGGGVELRSPQKPHRQRPTDRREATMIIRLFLRRATNNTGGDDGVIEAVRGSEAVVTR